MSVSKCGTYVMLYSLDTFSEKLKKNALFSQQKNLYNFCKIKK